MKRIAIVVLALSACAQREPGLKEEEFGAFFFWRVAGDPDLDVAPACLNETAPDPPEFEENSYLVYQVSEDGKTAVAQDCDRVDAASCKKNELDVVFDVDDTKLTAQSEDPIEPLSETCDRVAVLDWTVTDGGEEGRFELQGHEGVSGDDCTGFEGFADSECKVTLSVPLELDRIDEE